jgi:hypothetical protein
MNGRLSSAVRPLLPLCPVKAAEEHARTRHRLSPFCGCSPTLVAPPTAITIDRPRSSSPISHIRYRSPSCLFCWIRSDTTSRPTIPSYQSTPAARLPVVSRSSPLCTGSVPQSHSGWTSQRLHTSSTAADVDGVRTPRRPMAARGPEPTRRRWLEK